jgi:hypothetical protein
MEEPAKKMWWVDPWTERPEQEFRLRSAARAEGAARETGFGHSHVCDRSGRVPALLQAQLAGRAGVFLELSVDIAVCAVNLPWANAGPATEGTGTAWTSQTPWRH